MADIPPRNARHTLKVLMRNTGAWVKKLSKISRFAQFFYLARRITGSVQKGSAQWSKTVCRGRPSIEAPPGKWLPWGEERDAELSHFSLSLEACHFGDESSRRRGHGNFARQRSAGADVLIV